MGLREERAQLRGGGAVLGLLSSVVTVTVRVCRRRWPSRMRGSSTSCPHLILLLTSVPTN